MKIITLTLSPAYDLHCFTEHFTPYRENLARITQRQAGGKGVNISRALKVGGIENLALVVLGNENCHEFENALITEKINYRAIKLDGRIRENITLHTSDSDETRISFEGASADSSLLCEIFAILEKEELADSVVTLTGRVPAGISMVEVTEFLIRLKEAGTRLVIDSRSFSLSDLRLIRPYLIKPNQEEISEYLSVSIDSLDAAKEAALSLYNDGIENVMISLGELGALLVCDDGTFTATPPSIAAVSTIGAGDSSIGGFLSALAEGRDKANSLRLAIAYGTAACLTEGTAPPRKEDIDTILPKILLNKI